MTKLREVYKCQVCGNIVEVVHGAPGVLVCCGKPMTLVEENTVDAAFEKHIPVIEKVDGGYLVKVGEVEHPMMDAHYIEWIELLTDNKVLRKELKPGDKPEAMFNVEEQTVAARAYCNLHGLWKK